MQALAMSLACTGVACFDTETTRCADGLRCPAGTRCVAEPAGGYQCAPEAEAMACLDMAEDSVCVLPSGEVGECRGGVCRSRCGNGRLDEGEVCDPTVLVQEDCVSHGADMGALGCDPGCTRIDTSQCVRFGWQDIESTGDDWLMLRAWSFSRDHALAVGMRHDPDQDDSRKQLEDALLHMPCADCGRIYRFDGTGWTIVKDDIPPQLDIWARGPDDVITVGAAGSMLRYDGAAWRLSQHEPGAIFSAVWGSSQDVYVAGVRVDASEEDIGGETVMLHRVGAEWVPMELPWLLRLAPVPIGGIWGTDPGNVLAVGQLGVVLHHDGDPAGTWDLVPSFPGVGERHLTDIWGTGPDDIVVVGDNITARYDGSTWIPMAVPEGAQLYGVGARQRREFLAAGLDGLVLHHDGSHGDTWVTHDREPAVQLAHVHGAGDGSAVAVGAGVVRHHDGSGWQRMDAGAPGGQAYGIWGPDAGCVYVAASGHRVWRHDGGAGGRWTSTDAGTGAGGALLDVWGTGCDDPLFAVGAGGTLLVSRGGAWECITVPTSATLRSVWGSGPEDVFAVGKHGTIVHYDGSSATLMPSGVDADLEAVWGSGPGDVYAVGSGSTVLRYDGSQWQKQPGESLQRLYDVWGSGPDDVFIAAGVGRILHFDGQAWTSMALDRGREMKAVWGCSADAVFAGGDDGVLFFYDGAQWTGVTSPTGDEISTLWGPPGGEQLWLGTDQGELHRLILPRGKIACAGPDTSAVSGAWRRQRRREQVEGQAWIHSGTTSSISSSK